MKPEVRERNINCHKRKRSARDKMCHFPKEQLLVGQSFNTWNKDEEKRFQVLPIRIHFVAHHPPSTLAAGKNKFLVDVLRGEFLFMKCGSVRKKAEPGTGIELFPVNV